MAVDPRTQLERAKELIKAKRYTEARQILQTVNHLTAEKWLEKLDEIEMFGSPISATPAAPTSIKPLRQNRSGEQLLQQAVAVFVQHDWEVGVQMQGMVQVEKKRAPANFTSFLVIAFLGLLGMAIVLLGIATAKVEKVSLQTTDDGRLQVSGRKEMFITDDHTRVYKLAQSVRNGAGYAGAIALGVLSTIFWIVVL